LHRELTNMPYSFSGRLNMPMLFLMLLADRVAFLW
jgi:hypothetical protein